MPGGDQRFHTQQLEQYGVPESLPMSAQEQVLEIRRQNDQAAQTEQERKRFEEERRRQAAIIMATPGISDDEKAELLRRQGAPPEEMPAPVAPQEPPQFAPDPRVAAVAGQGQGGPPANPMGAGISRIGAQQRKFEGQMMQGQEQAAGASISQENAVTSQAAAQTRLAQDEATMMGDARRRAQEQEQVRAENENARLQQMQRAEAALNDMLDELRTKKIDPNRLQGRETRVRIGNTIGNIFGTMAAAKLGVAGSTFAQTAAQNMEALQSAIGRDIQAQTAEIDNLRTTIGAKQNGLQMMRNRFGDERAAESALRVALWDDVEQQWRQKTAEARVPEIQAKAEEQLAAIQGQRAQATQAFAGVMNENALRAINAQENLRATGQQLQIQAAKADGASAALPPVTDTEWIGPATEKDREEVAKIMVVFNPLKSSIDDLRRFREKNGFSIQGSTARTVGRVKLNRMKQLLRKAEGAGANFTESEQELVYGEVPNDPSEMGRVAVRLDELSNRIQQENAERLRAYGARPRARASANVGGAE